MEAAKKWNGYRPDIEAHQKVLKFLELDNIIIHFQPIISLKRKEIVGFEALCRGQKGDKIVSPTQLFSKATTLGINLELDRLCREKALKAFKKLGAERTRGYPKYLLSLNIDPTIFDEPSSLESGWIMNAVKEAGLLPSQVILEITEQHLENEAFLKSFVKFYQKQGFLIAIDDIGKGDSNLKRIAELRPDIFKIERDLIKDVDKEWSKSKVLESIVFLAEKTGALCLAEGVERKEEFLCVVERGVDLVQGFYFSKPNDLSRLPLTEIPKKLSILGNEFKNFIKDKIATKRAKYKRYKQIANSLFKNILHYASGEEIERNENRLAHYIGQKIRPFSEVECVYVLNENGIQITETIFSSPVITKPKSPLFKPATIGDDLSSRDYFYYSICGNLMYFVTKPYISLATGNLVTTVAKVFKQGDKKFVLCIDIREKGNG